jgi:hypothetical protein
MVQPRPRARLSFCLNKAGEVAPPNTGRDRKDEMTKGDNNEDTAGLPSDYDQTLRQSLTRALESYHAPLEEIPPELRELLTRLKKQEK